MGWGPQQSFSRLEVSKFWDTFFINYPVTPLDCPVASIFIKLKYGEPFALSNEFRTIVVDFG